MQDDPIELEYHDLEDGDTVTSANDALPKVLDPVITMEVVQGYVESERDRSRRMLVWTGTAFLLILLLVLVVFVGIGIFVLGNSRKAADMANKALDETSVYASEVLEVSNTLGVVRRSQDAIRSKVLSESASRKTERRHLQSDLSRFHRWVASHNGEGQRRLAMLNARLKELEDADRSRVADLAAVRDQYAGLRQEVEAVAMAAPTAVPAAHGPAAHEGAPAARPMGPSAGRGDLPGDVFPAAANDGMPSHDVFSEVVVMADAPAVEASSPIGDMSVVVFPNGDRYEGEFTGGLFHGWGVYTYANGDRYDGEFRQDTKSGKGTFTYSNGDKYVGEFADDMKAGRGTFLFRNGDRYVGEFSRDMINGKGTLAYGNGNKYAGDFRNGVKHGNGVFKFRNGDSYTGEFREGLRQGQGTYAFSNGARYIGEFKDNRRHGRGRYVYAGGEEYIGEFRDGKKDGLGLSIYPDGRRIKGLWKADQFQTLVASE